MDVQLNPYLNFRDTARDAMEFYHSVFGGELRMQSFKEFGASEDPSDDDKVMHAQLEAGDVVFMASDTPSSMPYEAGTNFNMSLSGEDESRLRGYFENLSDGGNVIMPLEQAQWGDTFGMLIDRFGIRWLVNIGKPQS